MWGGRPCYYEVLGVARDASTSDIITAYIDKIMEWRLEGDSSTTRQSRERLQQIEEAYHVLSDVSRRATYDANVARHRQDQQPHEYNANNAYSGGDSGHAPGRPARTTPVRLRGKPTKHKAGLFCRRN